MIVGHQSRRHKPMYAQRGAGHTATVPDGAFQTVIPFDYAATFELTGTPGNLLHDVINFNTDGSFVATAIGYGLEEKSEAIELFSPGSMPPPLSPGDLTLSQIPPGALIRGFRVNPRFTAVMFNLEATHNEFDVTGLSFATNAVDGLSLNKVFESAPTRSNLSFMFSMVDTDSGRELQDEPTNNLASLGISNGERPFRMLARPMFFSPRSTLRMQIEERSEGVEGTLFIVLYGYKVLSLGCPEPLTRNVHGPAFCRTETIGNPSGRVIPFDYVTKFRLTGQTGNRVEDEIAINVEGGFVATAMGYGLAVEDRRVEISNAVSDPVDLSTLNLSVLPPDALIDGIRISPDYLRFVFDATGNLNTSLPIGLADEIFERLNVPENVSFRYTILDGGTGRDLQNQPIHNLGGLGIASGKRPFKQFVRPMIFLPRSTLRVTVEERSGRGELYIVFQGYKILGGVSARGGI